MKVVMIILAYILIGSLFGVWVTKGDDREDPDVMSSRIFSMILWPLLVALVMFYFLFRGAEWVSEKLVKICTK